VIAVGVLIVGLWCLAICGAPSARAAQANAPAARANADSAHAMPAALGVVLFLALLLGIVLRHRRDRDDD